MNFKNVKLTPHRAGVIRGIIALFLLYHGAWFIKCFIEWKIVYPYSFYSDMGSIGPEIRSIRLFITIFLLLISYLFYLSGRRNYIRTGKLF